MKIDPNSLSDITGTLAELKRLPTEMKSRLLLARLAKMGLHDSSALNKHNLMLIGDPYGLASGFPDAEKVAVREHLLGSPWTRLVNEGLLVDLSGQGFHKVTDEGNEYIDGNESPAPAPSPVEKPKPELPAPRAFLSYSWEGRDHQRWVSALAERLQGESGVEGTFDQWHLQPGDDKLHFMELGVSKADFVIVVCTPTYAERANQRSGGVGYESMVITAELAEHMGTSKFIPVLRAGPWASAMPIYLKSRWGLNLTGEPYDEQEYVKLLRALHREPIQPPPIGKKPDFSHVTKTEHSTKAEVAPSAQSDLAKIFIRTRPGERSGDVRTVRVSAVIENVSPKRKITDYVCTMSVPRSCLTHASGIILGELRQEPTSDKRVFRVSSSDPGRVAIIFQGDKVPLFALDLGIDQLKMTGTYLAGDYDGTLADKVTVDAVVEGERLHAERMVTDIFENPHQA
jgi:TIR domain